MPEYIFPQQPTYRIAQLTDCHLLAGADDWFKGIRPAHYLQQVITQLQQNLPDAVILTGDLTQDHTVQSYRLLRQLCQPLKCPVFVTSGNHDDPEQLQWLVSRPPFQPDTVLRLNGWQLLLVNTKGDTPAGVFYPAEQARLEQQLQPYLQQQDSPAVWLFCHHHPRPLGCFIDLHGQQDASRLWQFIGKYPAIRGIAHGHSHYAYQQQWQNVQIVGCPATSLQFLPTADWQTEDQGPGWCEWLFSADGSVNWQFKTLKEVV
ncbi:metallophosphoesterase [Chromatiaceae bacterium AAb-1]|nr:metallophosphoesterase [Chromatiaceae bacterium AAb-1]